MFYSVYVTDSVLHDAALDSHTGIQICVFLSLKLKHLQVKVMNVLSPVTQMRRLSIAAAAKVVTPDIGDVQFSAVHCQNKTSYTCTFWELVLL